MKNNFLKQYNLNDIYTKAYLNTECNSCISESNINNIFSSHKIKNKFI